MPRPANGCRSTPHRRRGVQWRSTRYTQWLDYALQILYIFLLGWFLIHRPFWKKTCECDALFVTLGPLGELVPCNLQRMAPTFGILELWACRHSALISRSEFEKSSHICIFLYFLGILLLRLRLPRVQDVQAFEAASNQSAGVLSRWLISSHRWEANTLIQCPTTRCALFLSFWTYLYIFFMSRYAQGLWLKLLIENVWWPWRRSVFSHLAAWGWLKSNNLPTCLNLSIPLGCFSQSQTYKRHSITGRSQKLRVSVELSAWSEEGVGGLGKWSTSELLGRSSRRWNSAMTISFELTFLVFFLGVLWNLPKVELHNKPFFRGTLSGMSNC